MIKRLAILGAGGHGKVVAEAAQLSNEWGEVVFFDDTYPEIRQVSSWPVEGSSDHLLSTCTDFSGVVVAIGNNTVRLEKTLQLLTAGAQIATVVHPAAVVSPTVTVGPGSVVLAGAVINIDAHIGMAVIVNTGAVVEHDCVLSDGVHISPNGALAGASSVGACSWVGIGAVVRETIKIGDRSIVGAGAVVVKSVADDTTVVGNPARIVK